MNQLHELVGRRVFVCVDQIGLKINKRGVLEKYTDGTFGITEFDFNMQFSAGKVSNIFDDGEKSPRIELY